MADDVPFATTFIGDNWDNPFDLIVPEEFDKHIIRVLLIIREILDHGFFSNYYNKAVLVDKIHNIDNFEVDVLVKKFSFVQLEERDEKTWSKDVVFETLKDNISDVMIRGMLRMYYAYNRTNIENYEDEYDGHILIEMARKVAPCLISYARSKFFNMEDIELDASDFTTYLLKKIAMMKEENFVPGKSTLYNLLMQLLLCFKRVKFLRSAILETITTFFTNLHQWLQYHKKQQLAPLQAEIFALLLVVAIDILQMVSAAAKISPAVEIPAGHPREYQPLYNILNSLQDYVPQYMVLEIGEALDLIYSY